MSQYELKPNEGFLWNRVTWGRPDSPATSVCSYCAAVLPDESSPLIISTQNGYAARFCSACQRDWWNLESFDDGEPG